VAVLIDARGLKEPLADFPVPAYDLIRFDQYLLGTLAWQNRNGSPVSFCCEATLNLAKQTQTLEMKREARFESVFVGIETPELQALKAMHKEHNAALPMLGAIRMLNSYGMEVISGIILGLDSDTEDTESRLREFIAGSQIPMLTINLLQALPKTPLWDRLQRDGRLITDSSRESNVAFLRPYADVVAMWRRSIAYAYDSQQLLERFTHQLDATYANRLVLPAAGRATAANLRRGATLFLNLLLRVGVVADYRKWFWRMVREALKRDQFESIMSIGFVANHLIEFSREALRGDQNASFYSARARDAVDGVQAMSDAKPLRRSA